SRRRHTRSKRDWSSDVCSSDLHEDRQRGRELMEKLITDLSAGVPKVLTELTTLGRTLKKRAADVLAYFERPGTSNGPTEALNGRSEERRVGRGGRSRWRPEHGK